LGSLRGIMGIKRSNRKPGLRLLCNERETNPSAGVTKASAPTHRINFAFAPQSFVSLIRA
jgi:hypothetical protein